MSEKAARYKALLAKAAELEVTPAEAYLFFTGYMIDGGCKLEELFALAALMEAGTGDPQETLIEASANAAAILCEVCEEDGRAPDVDAELNNIIDEMFMPRVARGAVIN